MRDERKKGGLQFGSPPYLRAGSSWYSVEPVSSSSYLTKPYPSSFLLPPHATLSQSWRLHYRDMRSPRAGVPLTTSRVAVIVVDFNSGNVLQLILDALHHLLLASTKVLFFCFRIACLFDLIILLWTSLCLRLICFLTLLLILLRYLL